MKIQSTDTNTDMGCDSMKKTLNHYEKNRKYSYNKCQTRKSQERNKTIRRRIKWKS